MAREPRPGPPRSGQKRQQGTVTFWMDENQRIPPLINQMPTKIPRTHMSSRVKSSCSSSKASRKVHLPLEQIKSARTEELDSIREELSQIKAQVDSLLESLERLDQQREHAETKESEEERAAETQQEPRGQRACPEADSLEGSTDQAQAVKNQASYQGCQ